MVKNYTADARAADKVFPKAGTTGLEWHLHCLEIGLLQTSR